MFDYLIDLPTKVKFGEGTIKELGTITSGYGKKAFVMHDPYLKGTAMLESILADLKASGVSVTIFDDVSPNPRDTVVDQAAALCAKEGCEVVIGIGGGSAIDSAKAIAIVAKNGGNTWGYTRRTDGEVLQPKKGKLPLIVVPTTSGTGTETTPFSVINNPALHFKATIVDDVCYPTVSLVDPVLMVTMPPKITALTGIDAFAHALEAYVSRVENPLIDILAIEAMRLFVENIEECVNNGSNVKAREKMALCSTLSGITIGHCCTTMPHAIAQALGGITDAAHGGAIATCINQVIEWTLPTGEYKFARIAEVFDPSLQGTDAQKAAKLPGYIEKLFRSITGEAVTMESYGLKEDQITDVVELVLKTYYGDCQLHPKVPTREDLMEVTKASF